MTPTETVEAFIAMWNNGDFAAMEGVFTDDAVYHNIPMEPVTGKAAIMAVINGFMADVNHCDWETHHIAANGSVVLTERTDRFMMNSGKVAAVRVMGTFEIDDDGLISAWRDYFDSAEMAREFGMGAAEGG